MTNDNDVLATSDEVLRREWMKYALTRIRTLVDLPRDDMTDDQLSIYTFAVNALAGGDPVIAMFDRGPGHRLCRVCLAEWSSLMTPDHAHGCPASARARAGTPDLSGSPFPADPTLPREDNDDRPTTG